MRRLVALGLGCLISATAASEDLLTIFDQAVVNDPLVREAEYTRKATREARPQAWAAYLPQIAGRGRKSKDEGSGISPFAAPGRRSVDTGNQVILTQTGRSAAPPPTRPVGSCSLRQSIFNWGQLVGLQAGGRRSPRRPMRTTASRSRTSRCACPRAISTCSPRRTTCRPSRPSLDAISRQLEQADKRFEVGLIAITDVQEARAARDTAAADLIAAKRQLATAQELLREITDMQYAVLATPRATMPLAMPEPADPQKWVEASMEQNLALTSSRLGADIARDDVRVQFGGHLPQVGWSSASRTSNRTDEQHLRRPVPGFPAAAR